MRGDPPNLLGLLETAKPKIFHPQIAQIKQIKPLKKTDLPAFFNLFNLCNLRAQSFTT